MGRREWGGGSREQRSRAGGRIVVQGAFVDEAGMPPPLRSLRSLSSEHLPAPLRSQAWKPSKIDFSASRQKMGVPGREELPSHVLCSTWSETLDL